MELITGGFQLFTGNFKVVILMVTCYCSCTLMQAQKREHVCSEEARVSLHIQVDTKTHISNNKTMNITLQK